MPNFEENELFVFPCEKVLYKYEIALHYGVSRQTLSRWLAIHLKRLSASYQRNHYVSPSDQKVISEILDNP
jgi:hypothetical protein